MNRLWVAALPWLAGCGIAGPCDHQRGIVLYATVDASDVREADQAQPLSMVAFWEHQADGFRREVLWAILSPRLRGSVIGVRLYDGLRTEGGGTLLYTFPIENAQASVGAIQQITAGSVEAFGDGEPGSWYQGTVPIEELMRRMYEDQTYIEVRTDSVPEGEFRAPLGTPRFFVPPGDPSTWRAVYCS